jgi:hypothetical protein
MNHAILSRWPIRVAVLVAGVGLSAGNAPAYAAVVEWRAGPLGLAAGQSAQIGISNPDIFPCSIGVQIRAGQVSGGTAFATQLLVNTIGNPRHVPAGSGLVVGVQDPNEAPGSRTLVQARVRADCPAGALARVRRLPVALEIVDRATKRTAVALQGVPQF